MKPRISLILSVYKQPRFLELQLESLKNQTLTDFEIIVADDGSGGDIKKVVETYQTQLKQPIRHVWHEDNGFRKTIIANKAVAVSRADYLVFVDGDCLLHHCFLEMHQRYQQAGCVLSGRRVCLDEALSMRLGVEDVRTRRIEKYAFWKNHVADAKSFRHGFRIPFSFYFDNAFRQSYTVLGCNMSLFKVDFMAVNGYDEDIVGRGIEDINLEARLRQNGCRILSLTRKALQYHIFHSYDPVPHSHETIVRLRNPESYWAKNGIDKYGGCP